jgi:hypothetical protein
MKANTPRTFGRKEIENVRDDSPYYTGSSTRGHTPCLATQQGLEILSEQWRGTGPSDRGRAPVNGPHLTGVRASQRNAQHSFAMRHGPATVNTSLREKEQVMSCHQLIEKWNGRVAKLCNSAINRLENAEGKGDVKATQTDSQLPSVKPCTFAGREEYHEIQHEEPGGRQVSQS